MPDALALLRDRAATEATSLHPTAVPAWRLPWTAGRLLTAAAAFPVLLLAVRAELGADLLAGPGWVALSLAISALGALLVGSYLPSSFLGRGRPLRTNGPAAAAFFYLFLAGYALHTPQVALTHLAFAAAVLALGLVARTRGTRALWHLS
jgi:hypothetical protein